MCNIDFKIVKRLPEYSNLSLSDKITEQKSELSIVPVEESLVISK
jgi:hypothetical protein